MFFCAFRHGCVKIITKCIRLGKPTEITPLGAWGMKGMAMTQDGF